MMKKAGEGVVGGEVKDSKVANYDFEIMPLSSMS